MLKLWEKLNPNQKRMAVLCAVVLVVFCGLFLFSGDEEQRPRRTSRDDAIRHVLTDRDTRTVGLESLNNNLKALERRNKELESQLEALRRGQSNAADSAGKTISTLTEQLKELQDQLKEISDAQRRLEDSVTAEQGAGAPVRREVGGSNRNARVVRYDPNNPERVFEERIVPEAPAAAPAAPGSTQKPNAEPPELKGGRDNGRGTKAALEIVTHTSKEDVEPDAAEDAEDELYLPTGTIITGVLLSGLDAPTGQAARRDPFPATLRIQHEAILPNRFRADVRECFALVSGYGDMSSERAYLRGEGISCVREDGSVMEARLDSYAVGEDGKAGVRGRLVSKEGALIARTLMAGFFSGAASALNVQAAPAIRLTDDNAKDFYTNAFSSSTAAAAVGSGASTALERLADYYMDMAEGIFPVIEVDAGRRIDIVVSKGTAIPVRNKASSNKKAGASK